MADFESTLEMRRFIEALEHNKRDVQIEFFEQCASDNNSYLAEGIFGAFGKWVSDKLGGNGIQDVKQFANVETKVKDQIINKYEGIPIDKIRIVVPVATSSDLEKIAKEGPTDAMMDAAIEFGKSAPEPRNKNVLKPADYKGKFKGSFKYAAIIDIPHEKLMMNGEKIAVDKSILKKGVWGAIILFGTKFEDMIPASVLGIDPEKTSLKAEPVEDKPKEDEKAKTDDKPKEDDKPADKAEAEDDKAKAEDKPADKAEDKPKEDEKPKSDGKAPPSPAMPKDYGSNKPADDAPNRDLDLEDLETADILNGASALATKHVDTIVDLAKKGKFTPRDLSKMIILLGRVEKSVRSAIKKAPAAS